MRDTEAEQAIKERETERMGKQDYFALRKNWSKYLCRFLAAMIAFQIILAFCIGWGWLSFKEDKVLLYTVVGENFVQIIGMCYIVVKFLFPIKSHDKQS